MNHDANAYELTLAFCNFWIRLIGGSKGGARDARPPWGSKFFHFHAVFGKNVKNNSNFGSWRPSPGENPGSATASKNSNTTKQWSSLDSPE